MWLSAGLLRFRPAASNAPVAPAAPPAPSPSSAAGGLDSRSGRTSSRAGLPDPVRWDHEEGLVRNQEAQYYTRQPPGERPPGGRTAWSSRHARSASAPRSTPRPASITKGRAQFLYGRIEVRARLPRGRGLWPAIWMLGANIGRGGLAALRRDRHHGERGVRARPHPREHPRGRLQPRGGHRPRAPTWTCPGVHDEFHLYALEWFPDHLDFFVDGRKYFTFAKESNDVRVWPFDRPHYLILNVAVGGAWGGAAGDRRHGLPQRMLVDYVRVFSRS